MSVASLGLESLNLDIDEDFLYSIPTIQLNKGGQIITITEGDVDNNIAIQTAVVLQECETIIDPLVVVVNNLAAQTSEIIDETKSLQSGVTSLTANVNTLVANINTLIAEINATNSVYEVKVNNYNVASINNVLSEEFSTTDMPRRRLIPLRTISLEAGVYAANFNWIAESIAVGTAPLNTDTRYKITYAYAADSDGNVLASSINNCSGHNGLNISHSSSFCFDLTATTTITFGIWYDIACTTYTSGTGLLYFFNSQQAQMYPYISNINTEILQVIKIG